MVTCAVSVHDLVKCCKVVVGFELAISVNLVILDKVGCVFDSWSWLFIVSIEDWSNKYFCVGLLSWY